jgi:hypothetical protein
MYKEQTVKLINLLNHIREKPGLYTGDGYEPEKIQVLLLGIRLCQNTFGLEQPSYAEIAEKRGWRYQPRGLIPEMKETGLSDQEIINELIEIEIEFNKKF